MQKKFIAMAVAGAFAAAPALASADVTLFGDMAYEVGAIDGADTDLSVDAFGSGNRDLTHSTAGSRIGVRGSEDLGNGLTGIFSIRGNFGNSQLGNGGHTWNEEVWVGLDGGFGQIRLGQSDTAMKNAMKSFRAFTDTLADNATRPGTIRARLPDGQGGVEDRITPNSWARTTGIHYQSPDFAGFTLGATLQPTGRKSDTYYALNGMYEMGPMEFSLAYEAQTGADPSDDDNYGALRNSSPIDGDTESYHAGFSYDFGPGDVGVKYHQWDSGSDSFDLKLHQWLVPANFRVTPQVNLRAAVQYNRVKPDQGDTESWTNVGVGAQYFFSNRTEAYVNIWQDGEVGTTPTNSGGLSNDGTHVGVGVRHSF